MRKHLLLTIVTGTLLALGSVATADSEWGFYGAYWAPSDGEDAFGGGLKIGFDMVDRVQLEIRAGIFNDLIDDVAGTAADLEDVPLEIGLAYAMPAKENLEFYLGGGLGYHFLDGSGSAGSVDNELGFYGTAGLEWYIHRSGAAQGETSAKLFIEVLYRFLSADGTTPVGPTDIDLDGPGVQLGLVVGW
jgi:hypothetical protein